MKKTDKKTDNAIREALTDVCEVALIEVSGFKWITHFINYSSFPDSLSIVCVFDTNNNLLTACETHKDDFLYTLIKEKLMDANIHVNNIRQHISFDTEEACQSENSGKWNERFR